MKRFQSMVPLSLVLLFALPFVIGCGGESEEESGGSSAIEVDGPPPEDGGHSHSSLGPNGGELVDLGREHKYHAEVVVNDGQDKLNVHILDGDQKAHPISANTISINVIVDGKPQVYELTAVIGANPKTSVFETYDAEVINAIAKHQYSKAEVKVTIEGTPYSGSLHSH